MGTMNETPHSWSDLQGRLQENSNLLAEFQRQRADVEAEKRAIEFSLDTERQLQKERETAGAFRARVLTQGEARRAHEDIVELDHQVVGRAADIERIERSTSELVAGYRACHQAEVDALWRARLEAEVMLLATAIRLQALNGPMWRDAQPFRSPQLPGGTIAPVNSALASKAFAWRAAKTPDDLVDQAAAQKALEHSLKEAETARKAGAERVLRRCSTVGR